MAVAPAVAGVAISASLVMSSVALVKSGERAAAPSSAAKQSRPPTAAPVVDVKIMGAWKLGPDGKKHDAWSQTEFAVKVGRPLALRIDNADSSPHSLTSVAAGVSIIALPGVHTYTLLVHKHGRFHWRCEITCDTGAAGWAMTHPGYMSGYITAS